MNGLRNSWNREYTDQDASDEELPTAKGKSTFKERSAAVGREAALQKQLQEATRDRQELVKRYEIKDQKCNELRDKLKVTKAALASRERELEMAQRLLQKLGAEKTQLREESADNKVYTRKLEARLEELKSAADLSSKYQSSKQKAHDLQHQLVAVTAELAACKEVAEQHEQEVQRLNRALEIRASELSEQAGGQDIPAKLLHALAESREESLLFAKQLAATKAEMHKLKASAARLSSRVEAAELMRADAEVAAEQLRQRLEKLVGSSHEVTKQRSDMAQLLVSARSESEGFKAERDELAEVVLEMQEEIEQLKAATTAAKTNGKLAAAAAADEAMQHIAHSHAAAADARQQQQQRETQLNQRCSRLAEQASQREAALQKQLTAAQQAAAAQQQQLLVLESQLQNRRQRELELERHVAELKSRTEKLGGAVSSAEAAASKISKLEQQVIRLEASLRVASVERQQLEQRLQQMGDDAAAAQQEAQREMDGLRVQLAAKEAAHRCSMEDVAELQKELKQVVEQLEKASTSKAQLQHSMLHQISSIKEKLQQAELQSQQQLGMPTSPIFPRHSSSTGLRASSSIGLRGRASSKAGPDAAAAGIGGTPAAVLDAARKARCGAARRSIGSQMTAAGAGSSRQKQPGATHSTGSMDSCGSSTWQQQQLSAAAGATGGSSKLRDREHKGVVLSAAARVADFAASLQQSESISTLRHHHLGDLALSADAGTAVHYEGRAAAHAAHSTGRDSVHASTGGRLASAPSVPAHINVSHSYDSRAGLMRTGSCGYDGFGGQGAEEDQEEVAFGVRSAAVMHLSSPPCSHAGRDTGRAANSTSSSRAFNERGLVNVNAHAGLADIASMEWPDILKVDLSGQLTSPPRSPGHLGGAAGLGGDPHSSRSPREYSSPQHSGAAAAVAGRAGAGAAGGSSYLSQEQDSARRGSGRQPAGSSSYAALGHGRGLFGGSGGAATGGMGDGCVGGGRSQHSQHSAGDDEWQHLSQSQSEYELDAAASGGGGGGAVCDRSPPGGRHSASKGPAAAAAAVGSPRACLGEAAVAHHTAAAAGSAADCAGAPGRQAAAAGGTRNALSWLQQPVEPYSPSVVPVAGTGAHGGQQAHRPAAAAAAPGSGGVGSGRSDDSADPYSLPASAEQSALSLVGHDHGLVSGGGGGMGLAGGQQELRASRGSSWQHQQQQQQQQQQHHHLQQQQPLMPGGDRGDDYSQHPDYSHCGDQVGPQSSSPSHRESAGADDAAAGPASSRQRQQSAAPGSAAASPKHHQQQQQQQRHLAHHGAAAAGHEAVLCEEAGGFPDAAGSVEPLHCDLSRNNSSILNDCGAMEVTFDSDSCSDEQGSRHVHDHSRRTSNNSGVSAGDYGAAPAAAGMQHSAYSAVAAAHGVAAASGGSAGGARMHRVASMPTAAEAAAATLGLPHQPHQPQQPRSAAASPSPQRVSRLEATRAALRDLSSRHAGRSSGATGSPAAAATAAAAARDRGGSLRKQLDDSSSERDVGMGSAAHKGSSSRQQQQLLAVDRVTDSQAAVGTRSSLSNLRAAVAASTGRTASGRCVSDSSSSGGSTGRGSVPAAAAAAAGQLRSSRASFAAAAAQHALAGGALLSPPSTGKLQRAPSATARSAGMRPVPMQDLKPAADTACGIRASTGRLNPAQQQQQQQRGPFPSPGRLHHDPSLASWNGEEDEEGSRDGSGSILNHRALQRGGSSSVLAEECGRRVSSTAGAGGAGAGRGAAAGRQSAGEEAGSKAVMDVLLAKLQAGQPTLQDLADLESLL